MIEYLLTLAILIVVGVVLALSLNLVMGYSGMMSVSHGALMGVGAYVTGVLSTKFGWEPAMTLVLGTVAAGLVGWLFMNAAARLDPDDFILASFTFQMAVIDLFTQWTPVTNGSYGLFGIRRPALLGVQLNDVWSLTAFALVFGALAWLALSHVGRSRYGIILRGMRESHRGVEAAGKNVLQTQVMTFAFSGAFAGLAGAVYAVSIGVIIPNDFAVQRSILVIAFLLVGGIGNMTGAVLGAVALLALPELVKHFGSIPTQWEGPGEQILYGVIIVLFVWLRPQGIIPERPILMLNRWRAVGRGDAHANRSQREPADTRIGSFGAPLVEVRNVTVRFGGLTALEDVSLVLEQGKITALIGPNGAGKSTLLNVVSGFQQPTSGSVLLRGESLLGRKPHEIVDRGLVRSFQNVEVFGRLTSAENLALALPHQVGDSMVRLFTSPRACEIERRSAVQSVGGLLDRLGIDEYADELAENLSYGAQKQVIVGRLMASGAGLLMFDEPGAGLPRASAEKLGKLFRRLVQEEDKTILLIDHNMELVLNFADIVYVLHTGRVIVSGTPEEIRGNQQVLDVYLSRNDHSVAARSDAMTAQVLQ